MDNLWIEIGKWNSLKIINKGNNDDTIQCQNSRKCSMGINDMGPIIGEMSINLLSQLYLLGCVWSLVQKLYLIQATTLYLGCNTFLISQRGRELKELLGNLAHLKHRIHENWNNLLLHVVLLLWKQYLSYSRYTMRLSENKNNTSGKGRR